MATQREIKRAIALRRAGWSWADIRYQMSVWYPSKSFGRKFIGEVKKVAA